MGMLLVKDVAQQIRNTEKYKGQQLKNEMDWTAVYVYLINGQYVINILWSHKKKQAVL